MRLHSTVGFQLPVKANSVKQKKQEPIVISNSRTHFAGGANEDVVQVNRQVKQNNQQSTTSRKGKRDKSDAKVSNAELGVYYLFASLIAASWVPIFAMPPLIAGVVTLIQDARGEKVKKKPDSGSSQP
jgi:hypothetical protein